MQTVEIIEITNCQMFNGKILTLTQFTNLLEVLELSTFVHIVTYRDDSGVHSLTIN
jgi:hypothetical protein